MIVSFRHNDKTWHSHMEAVPRVGERVAIEGYTKFPLQVREVVWSWSKDGTIQGRPMVDLE